ncbi:DUF6003 family protein [Streptomyces inhibens]|uniref:DUF6003 family protein n=1 Tax=Streptomyces inhibens TaxID=2293571 RepID=UPI00402A603D
MDIPAPMDRAASGPPGTLPASGAASPPGRAQAGGSGSEDLEQELLTYSRYMRSRDELIRRAKAAGFTEVRIAQLIGHSRNTVRSALK